MSNFILSPDWVDLKTAKLVISKYTKYPKTKNALISAAEKGEFIRRNPDDGFHWQFNLPILKDFMDIYNLTSLSDLAKELNVNPGSVKYLAVKNGIFPKVKYGKKYLTENDITRLKILHQRSKK